MKTSVISTIFLVLATATRIQKANGASSGEEQLREAARRNNFDLAKSLLDSGVDAKATDEYGGSALMYAATNADADIPQVAQGGRDKLVELLLPFSDAKQTSKEIGWSALMLSAEMGREKSVKLLLPFSDVKATNSYGDTALSLAKELPLKFGRNQIVRLLQQYSN